VPPLVKICGLSTEETLAAALEAGAERVGLVFFPRSPRSVTLDRAAALAAQARGRAAVVALVVDAEDAALDAVAAAVAPDMWQFHGRETPERVAALRARLGRPVMKALGVSTAADLDVVPAFAAVADEILFDAKPPKGAALPGGNGVAFDWQLLAALDLPVPFMLSGGLGPHNVGEALRVTRAPGVDVSSGVENAPGVKDPDLIAAFIRAAKIPAARIPATKIPAARRGPPQKD
jgi:phosphoribosylanthranilate isomerase